MNDEIKKMKKKENIMTVLLVFLILLFVFVIILVVTRKEDNGVLEEPQIIDENTYIDIDNIDNTEYMTVYKNANLKKVTFKNIPLVLVSNFYTKQYEFINTLNNNIIVNKDFIDKYNTDNNITDYTVNSEVDTILLFDLKDNILSLLYLIEDNVDYVGINNYITNIFVDVSTSSIINTNELLTRYNLNKENISLEVFKNVINYHDDIFIDKDTNEETTKDDIIARQDEYINLLIENFDAYIYLYFNQENLYLKYNRNDISELLFNEELDNVKYSTLKLEI